MGCYPPLLRRKAGEPRNPTVRGLAAAVAALTLTVSCSPVPSGAGSASATSSATSTGTDTATAAAVPVTAVINQLRDNYSTQIIAIQLTNTAAAPVTVHAAGVASTLFTGAIEWQARPGGIELPPGQTKILPAQLPAAECGLPTGPVPQGALTGGAPTDGPVVHLRLAAAPGSAAAVPATDPYGVLARNNAEMCLAQAAAAVAGIRLAPELEVSADGQSAVMALIVTPRRSPPGPADPGSTGSLTINWIGRTPLLDEDRSVPWPRSVSVHAGGASQQFRLGIRPARCDPHAVAEDKVGTLMPLRVSAGGREGILKISAGDLLRGRIHDFISTACGRQ
ncbi:MAG TPA: hypothetical protein VLT34_03055 [Arthrobacter sp.]|nr:hypothetical protein [Arthrobacter sp.]